MKVGNLVGGLEVVDVKRVNKLNLIQFLKEVDSYLQKGYRIDVNSARQVGLVLMADVFKTEAAFGGVGSTDVDSVEPELEKAKVEETSLEEPVAEATEQSVESAVKEEEVVKDEAPVVPKKTTTRSKKTTQ